MDADQISLFGSVLGVLLVVGSVIYFVVMTRVDAISHRKAPSTQTNASTVRLPAYGSASNAFAELSLRERDLMRQLTSDNALSLMSPEDRERFRAAVASAAEEAGWSLHGNAESSSVRPPQQTCRVSGL
jgi:hypothetical protein